jgi:hypothetical protein
MLRKEMKQVVLETTPNNQVAFSPETPLGGNGHGSDETEYEFPWAW